MTTRHRPALAALLAAAVLACAGPAQAAGGGASISAEESADFRAGLEAIKDSRWSDAIRAFSTHVSRAGDDADAHNWLGYAYRKSGNLPKAFTHYKRALAIDPRHKGVHEYLGEAYVMEGNIAQAQVHLKRLAEICNAACEEYEDLKKAIETKKVQ